MCTNHIECAVLSCFFMYKLPTLPSLSKSLHPQQFHYSYLNSLITIVNNFLNVNHFFLISLCVIQKVSKNIKNSLYNLSFSSILNFGILFLIGFYPFYLIFHLLFLFFLSLLFHQSFICSLSSRFVSYFCFLCANLLICDI